MFHVTVGLGAFLLFFVQPLVAKLLLPWFGGGPAVWSACLMFFQIALVAGYAYAHVSRRLGPSRQVLVHLLLLLGCLALLPIAPDPARKPVDGEHLVTRLVAVLTLTVGLPFLLLSTTAPLLQDWFARLHPARSPYPLYVVSNVGALGALLCYPALVEPNLSSASQAWWWSLLFGAFVTLVVVCGWRVARLGMPAVAAAATPAATDASVGSATPRSGSAPASSGDGAYWVLLPATGTALLVATTSQLSQDVAALPLIWIVPLALYLVTYIAGFAGWYRRTIWGAVLVVSVAITLYGLLIATGWSLRVQATWLLAAFFSAGLVCHGELARLKPAAHRLTAFYLALSIGGAIGGTFMAIGAPALFDRYIELPLALLAACALLATLVARESGEGHAGVRIAARIAVAGLAVVTALVVWRDDRTPDEVTRHRNYYGLLRVVSEPPVDRLAMRLLYHGRVLHGAQFLDAEREDTPTTYYGASTGVGVAIARHPQRQAGRPLHVGAIGLGVGTLAAYGRAGDTMQFFEIDPAMHDLARTHFTFLARSPAAVDVVMGDARLSLERLVADEAARPAYDVLVVDAFSGDAIPVHLLTRESFSLYRRTLAPGGVLAVHVSNQYLDLKPVVLALADDAGLEVRTIALSAVPAFRAPGSTWMLLTDNQAFLSAVRNMPDGEPADPRRLYWTDDFSSLIRVIR